MSAIAPQGGPVTPEQIRRQLSGANISTGRRVRNKAATVAMAIAFLLAAGPLALMAANVFSQGRPAVMTVDWWTQPIPADGGRADLAGNERLDAACARALLIAGPGGPTRKSVNAILKRKLETKALPKDEPEPTSFAHHEHIRGGAYFAKEKTT